VLDSETRPRGVAIQAADIADLLKRQWMRGEVSPDLVAHARTLVSLVQKEQVEIEGKNPPR
jgi:hypothetical protein